jgi:hypothetical protein
MDAVVQRVFSDRLADRQLDESHLTLTDLDAIRRSFTETLRGVYHPRVEYPDAGPAALPAPAAPQPAVKPGAVAPEAMVVNPPNA